MTEHLLNVAAAVTATSAAIGAIAYLTKKLRAAFRLIDSIETVVGRELTANSGSSMKDKVDRNTRNVERLTDHVVALTTASTEIRGLIAEHHRQSRAALAIYRKGLADQGVHLPIAPGELGYGDTDEAD